MAKKIGTSSSRKYNYTCARNVAAKTHLVKYSRRFRIRETEREMSVEKREKARAVAICKTPKHHVDGADLRSLVSFILQMCKRHIVTF